MKVVETNNFRAWKIIDTLLTQNSVLVEFLALVASVQKNSHNMLEVTRVRRPCKA